MKIEKEIYEKIINKFISNFCPQGKSERLTISEHFLMLASTNPLLAADSLLKKEMVGRLEETIGEIVQQVSCSGNNIRALVELAFNLYGLESKKIGLSQLEKDVSLRWIADILKKWERISTGKQAIDSVIGNILKDMKRVSFGNSMVAKIAENIEIKIDRANLAESFLVAAKSEIEGNIYFKMADQEMCGFGNDSALGLRFIRHMGFFCTTTNPIIISGAYKDFPELWDDFEKIAKINPEWFSDPKKYADDLAIFATINSVLPNLLILRPIALLSEFGDGMVTYQLNPFFSEDPKASIDDAKTIYEILKNIVYFYDIWLGWGESKWNGRPNIVFKVAASSPKSIEIIETLNEIGIGTNNTAACGVSQEITLLFSQIEGIIKARRNGIPTTKVYQANIMGRLESHLREVEARKLIEKMPDKIFLDFAKEILSQSEIKISRKDAIEKIFYENRLKSLSDEKMIRFFKDTFGEKSSEILSQKERDVEQAGIFVSKRVYQMFFGEKLKISQWFEKKSGLPFEDIAFSFDRIDLLPASKRRGEDTYSLLGFPNVTNAETPEQQLRVYQKTKEENFDLGKLKDSIKIPADFGALKRLLEIEDFRKAYEISPDLKNKLRDIGIEGDFGSGGMEPKDWGKYAAIEKMMDDFKKAYSELREMAMSVSAR